MDGCITAINNMKMEWDFKDQLQQVDLGGGGTAYYVYDGSGQRVRKVIETRTARARGAHLSWRIRNLPRIQRQWQTVTLERETLHIMDDKRRIALMETKTVANGSLPI